MADELRQLAETLMKTRMASSMYDAMEKAKSILNVKSQKPSASEQAQNRPMERQQPAPDIGVNIKDESVTLNELMREIGVDPGQVERQEGLLKREKLDNVREKVSEIKEDIMEAGQNPEKIGQIREDIEEVREEMGDIENDIGTENEEQAENAGGGKLDDADEDQLDIDDELRSLESEQQEAEQQNTEDEQQEDEQIKHIEDEPEIAEQEETENTEEPEIEEQKEEEDDFQEERKIDSHENSD